MIRKHIPLLHAEAHQPHESNHGIAYVVQRTQHPQEMRGLCLGFWFADVIAYENFHHHLRSRHTEDLCNAVDVLF
jgi:hypothetical protein